jgi:hypothetical protein
MCSGPSGAPIVRLRRETCQLQRPHPNPDKVLRDLLESAEQARTATQVYWRLVEAAFSISGSGTIQSEAGESRPFSFPSSNPGAAALRKYRDFFDIVEHSLLQTTVLAICRIFEHGEGHSSVSS